MDGLEGACVGLLLLQVASGVGALFALPASEPMHRRAADLMALLAVPLLVAGLGSGLHRVSPRRWRLHVVLAAASWALFALGSAATAGAEGVAGRAHAGDLLGSTPSRGSVVLAHTVLGSALTLAGAALLGPLLRGGAWPLGGLLGAPSLALALAAAWPPGPPLPPVAASLASPPWTALPIIPLEETIGLRWALLAASACVATLLAMPSLDAPMRPPWARRAVVGASAAGLLALLVLLVFASLVPHVAPPG